MCSVEGVLLLYFHQDGPSSYPNRIPQCEPVELVGHLGENIVAVILVASNFGNAPTEELAALFILAKPQKRGVSTERTTPRCYVHEAG